MRRIKQLWRGQRGFVLTVLCFVCVLALALFGLNTVQDRNSSRQTDALRQAVIRAAVACYASEGFYPASMDYLAAHYGLGWDQGRYIIHYDCFAQNILPDVRVLVRGDGDA